jgi:hypothetical protein
MACSVDYLYRISRRSDEVSKLQQVNKNPVFLPPKLVIYSPIFAIRLSLWPRGLRRRLAVAGLLGFRVLFRRGHGCLSVVSVVCCQVEVCVSG